MESLEKLQAGQKDGPLLLEDLSTLHCYRRYKFAKKSIWATLTIFMLLTSTGSSTERTVAFL